MSGARSEVPYPIPEEGLFRRHADGALVACNAVVTGDVHLGRDVNVWFHAMIRGDCSRITVGERTNIQDGTLIHTDDGFDLEIGPECTIGHMAMIHGVHLGPRCLVGMNAVLLGGCSIGEGSVVAAGAVVRERMEVPAGSLVAGVPARIVRPVGERERAFLRYSVPHYIELARRYLPRGEQEEA